MRGYVLAQPIAQVGPATLTTVLFGAGVALILLAIPLAGRMIPPNGAYGVRMKIIMENPATLAATLAETQVR
jgi:hypothetical protein